MNFESITLNRLEADLKALKYHSENDSYLQTYPEFIRYFESIPHGEISEHHLVIASHFVYGWMPTILKKGPLVLSEKLRCFNEVRSGKVLTESQLEALKPAVNNSMVGLSKLLHFINPEVYPIWDSKVYRYINGNMSYHHINKPSNYLGYLKRLHALQYQAGYEKLHHRIETYFKKEFSPLRAMELVMFESEK